MKRETSFVFMVVITIMWISSTSAISTTPTATTISETENTTEDADAQNIKKISSTAPSNPTPSITRFSKRRGTLKKKPKEEKHEAKEAVDKNSTSASSLVASSPKSPEITSSSTEDTPVPSRDDRGYRKPAEDEEPYGVPLEIIDEKGEDEVDADKEEDEGYDSRGRAKFPRIYYGEEFSQNPHPNHNHAYGYGSESTLDKNPQAQKENHQFPSADQYNYPKEYVKHKQTYKLKNKHFHKPEGGVRHIVEESGPYIHEHVESHHPYGRKPEYAAKEIRGPEFDEGRGPDHHGFTRGHHPHGFYGPSGAEIVSKALNVLLPSALLVTGLSAIFPTRIHVPTNDHVHREKTFHRNKRSIHSSEMLPVEHRGFEIELDPYPASYKSYNFEIGSPRRKYKDVGMEIPEFVEIPVEEEVHRRKDEVGGSRRRTIKEQPSSSGSHSNEQEKYDLFESQSVPRGRFNSPLDHENSRKPGMSDTSLNSIDYPEKKKRKVRTRSKVKIVPGKRRSRPLPTTEATPTTTAPPQQFLRAGYLGLERPTPTEPAKEMELHPSSNHEVKAPGKQHEDIFKFGDAFLRSMAELNHKQPAPTKEVDLSPDGPVMGLIRSYADHEKDSPTCQKRALCELAVRGKNPSSTKFETFLWSLASLVPEQFSKLYDLDEVFGAIRGDKCNVFQCIAPNMDIQL